MPQNQSYAHKVLKNGIQVILCHIPTVQSVFLRIDLKNGSVFEDNHNHGISHVVEHYLHQGNKIYPHPQEFTTQLEKEGMYENAATYLFGTYFWIKAPIDKTKNAIHMLHSMLAIPTFPEERLKHVQDVIMQEYHDHWQYPESKFYQDCAKKRFIDTPQYLQNSLGNKNVIENISTSDVQSWFQKFYHAPNMLISITGNIDTKALSFLEESFGTIPTKDAISYPTVSEGHYSKFLVHHQFDPREQITFNLSFPAFGWEMVERRDERTANFLARLIASGRFSRLNHVLREEHNLVYSVSAGISIFPSRGTLGIQGSTSKTNLVKTLTLVKKELEKIKKKGFLEEEIEIAKNIYASGLIFNQETPEQIGEFIRDQIFWDLPIETPKELLDSVRSISKKEVYSMTRTIFDFSRVNVGLFGNLNDSHIKSVTSIFS